MCSPVAKSPGLFSRPRELILSCSFAGGKENNFRANPLVEETKNLGQQPVLFFFFTKICSGFPLASSHINYPF